MHTIMVSLDGSPIAETVLPHVLPVAARLAARLVLVAVHEPDVPSRGAVGIPTVDRRVDAEARALLGAYLGDIARRFAVQGVSVDTAVLQGAPAERLAWYAATAGVDLLAMASHGRGGVTRLWLGSVTDRVLRHVDVPVLVVHAGHHARDAARPAGARRVLVPLDGRPESESIGGPLADLVGSDAVDFTLLRIVKLASPLARAASIRAERGRDLDRQRSEAAAYLVHAAERLAPCVGTAGTLVRTSRDPGRQILATAAEVGADLIALTAHGGGVVGRALMGSVADKVLRGARVPVLLQRVARAVVQPHARTYPSSGPPVPAWTLPRP